MAHSSIGRRDGEAPAGVVSRASFVERAGREYDLFFSGELCLCYLHIVHLRAYNRAHGIEVGDELLHRIMDLLLEHAVDHLVGRYAGNAIIFFMTNEEAEQTVSRINEMLPSLGDADGLEAKIGAAVCQSPMSVEECVRRAQYAFDSIRERKGVSYRSFDSELEYAFDKRNYVIDHLDDAIAAGEIQAWAQPIIRILTGKVCEVEVLARWMSERYGFLRPDEFIPELERRRKIHKLDLEVIRRACEQWCEAAELKIDVPFGINLSRLDFELCDIFSEVNAIMARYGVPVEILHVEVTESAVAQNNGVVAEGIERFREAGFRVYMDDFGSGYSSLGQMAHHRFDVIKIDKSMVDDIETNKRARAVLSDTVALVKRLGMQTLCEGVETAGQLEFLHSIGCEKAQGFYFSKPQSRDQILETLKKQSLSYNNHEDAADTSYYDAIGQINMLEGTSVEFNGIEAAMFTGRTPVAVIELGDAGFTLLAANNAYMSLIKRMGFDTFDDFVVYTNTEMAQVGQRAGHATDLARETGEEQRFDFIVGGVFCSAAIRLIARTKGKEAYLNTVSSVENSPQVTEHTLLMGVLETGGLNIFWKDVQRRFLGANQHFLDYYGFESAEYIIGKTDEDMGWNGDEEAYRNSELDALAGKTIVDLPGVCMHNGELRKIVATKRPLYSNGAIVGLVGYFRDLGPAEE